MDYILLKNGGKAMNVTKQLDWLLGPNRARGIKHFGTQREFEPWPDWMVAAIQEAPFQVKVLANLILGTGQRPGAAVAMRHDQFQ